MSYPYDMRTLLLVESETSALSTAAALSAAGFGVVRAASALDATNGVESNRAISLAVVDLDRQDSLEVAKRILAIRSVPILYRIGEAGALRLPLARDLSCYGLAPKDTGVVALSEHVHLAYRLFDAHRTADNSDADADERSLRFGGRVSGRAHRNGAGRENPEWYRLVAEHSSDAILVLNGDFGCEFVSPSIESLLGYTPTEIMESESMHAVHPDDLSDLRAAIQQDLGSRAKRGVYVHRELTKLGELRWVESRATFLYDEAGNMRRGVVAIRDITERKHAEEALAEERDRVRQLLGHQKLLLDEIHHRVKNDMSFVISLLSLQANQAMDSQTEFSLREAAKRVTVLSSVYERLHRTGNFKVMSVKELVDELAGSLRANTIPRNGVLQVFTEEFVVPTREAVSLGIILNELITNCAKYAFDSTNRPVVRVSVELIEENRVRLTVEDNGAGFAEGIVRGEEYGYGLTIVEALVSQHEGSLQFSNQSGGIARVELPFEL